MNTPSHASLQFDLTPADLDAFAAHHVAHAPDLTRRIRRMRLVWTVVFTVIALEYARTSPTGALGFVGIAIAYLAFYGRLNRFLYLRQTRSLGGRHVPGIGRVTLTLTSDELHVEAANGTAHLARSAIRRVEESPERYFLYVGPSSAIVVPRLDATHGDPDAFVRAVRTTIPPP